MYIYIYIYIFISLQILYSKIDMQILYSDMSLRKVSLQRDGAKSLIPRHTQLIFMTAFPFP